jgi:hypothetical protein
MMLESTSWHKWYKYILDNKANCLNAYTINVFWRQLCNSQKEVTKNEKNKTFYMYWINQKYKDHKWIWIILMIYHNIFIQAIETELEWQIEFSLQLKSR